MKNYISKHFRRLGLRRTDSPKDPTVRRDYPPGAQGSRGRRRLTQYGIQLAEKQKAKVIYNILERQLRRYYDAAKKKRGDTGEILKQLLEMRLDNVIYRVGFAKSRGQARQLVNHCFFLVNGKKVNIPSCQVKIKDEISIKPQKQKTKIFEEIKNNLKEEDQIPGWIHFDPETLTAKIMSKPKPEETEQRFNTRLIVEFYSK